MNPWNRSRPWRLLCSVKWALALILLIAASALAGTLIQQNLPRGDYFRMWNPWAAAFLLRSGLTDVYHSWWFLGLLGLLALSLIACSVDRFPSILAAYRGQPDPAPEALAGQPCHRTFVLPGSLEAAWNAAWQALGKGRQGGEVLYLSRGAHARWGVLVIHTSLLLIFLGGMLGSLRGFKGFVNVVEGTSIRDVVLRGAADDEDERRRGLPFELRVDSFRIARYDTGQPSDYVSHVRILEKGRTVREQELRVNAPLSYRGLTFYQSSYGSVPEATFLLEHSRSGASLRATLILGEFQRLEDGTLLAFDAFSEDHHGMGPALQVGLQVPGQNPQELLLFQRFPEAGRPKVLDLRLRPYTGLQVSRDPGVPWVWAGCALLLVGMVWAFFGSHRQLWIRLEPCGEGVAWTVAGNASRNGLAFEKEFQALLKRIGAPDPSRTDEGKA